MTEKYPSGGEQDDLFEQINRMFIDSEVNGVGDVVEGEMNIIMAEQRVLELLVSALPEHAPFLAIVQDKHVRIIDIIGELEKNIGILPRDADVRKRLVKKRETLFITAELATEISFEDEHSVADSSQSPRAYKTRILLSNHLGISDKVGLMSVVDDLLVGEDLDISDPNDILRAMNERDKQVAQEHLNIEIRKKATILFKQNIDEVYDVLKTDPEYTRLVNSASRVIESEASARVHGDAPLELIGTRLFTLLIDDQVTALGVDAGVIEQICIEIVETLVKEYSVEAYPD